MRCRCSCVWLAIVDAVLVVGGGGCGWRVSIEKEREEFGAREKRLGGCSRVCGQEKPNKPRNHTAGTGSEWVLVE